MPSYSHQVEVNMPIRSVWEFVSRIDNWAPLVPGYLEHHIISEKESTWSFKTDIGIMKKKVQLKVDITSWQEPTKVTFDLIGMNEKFTGNGYFRAEVRNETNTNMTGFLDINAEGLMAKMANSILNTSLPEITAELTEAVAAKIEEGYHANINISK
ncbi:SRPBCC family protein [Bacillus sp. FJAT-29790]|uniref:CoxG family protein n=1 Tax=Bacillus sp. FJAT-29790 TaxID=1895002 RepID=UPI001C214B67|nr:SRPBCC family protein [Bacillus sp. FJAT-29790]MBU8880452.1 SRPBCC family protein [Bacillus sp. FJAT-29790]